MSAANVREIGAKISDEIGKAVVGKDDVIAKLITAIMTGHHVLFEDYPGLAKTLMAKSLAAAMGLQFKRIQFTPDLLPGDVTGGFVFDKDKGEFELRKGPIFAHIVLADEINRASPKTQSALLEAMEEKQVTIEGTTHPLPEPFIVLATQNPVEYEGTFPLPEAQLDRFALRLRVGYPDEDEEVEIMRRRESRRKDSFDLARVVDQNDVATLRTAPEDVRIHEDIRKYIVNLVHSTRNDHRINVGASPRGALALQQLSRARAALEGRSYVVPDDVKNLAVECLAHRMILEPDYWVRKHAAEGIVQSVVDTVAVPVLDEG